MENKKSDMPNNAKANTVGKELDGELRKHQDLSKENLGNEPEEMNEGDPSSPYKLKNTLDDKRPENSDIEKGWTVDSNTSRGPQDLQTDTSEDDGGKDQNQ